MREKMILRLLALVTVIGFVLMPIGCAEEGFLGDSTPSTSSVEHASEPERATGAVTTYPPATVPTWTGTGQAGTDVQTVTLGTVASGTIPVQTKEDWKCVSRGHAYHSIPCMQQTIACSRCGHEENVGMHIGYRVHDYENDICTHCGEHRKHEGLQFILARERDPYNGQFTGDPFYAVCGLGSYTAEHLTIPQTFCGIPVRMISKRAFADSELVSVEIPSGITFVEDEAFASATRLSRVVLGEGIRNIGTWAFTNTAISEIVIPSTVEEIHAWAFKDCAALASVRICEGVKELHGGAFMNCAALADLQLADSIEYIGGQVFMNCVSLKQVMIPAAYRTVSYDSYEAFMGCTALESVTFQNGCTMVGSRMFQNCVSLRSVILPQSLTRIAGSAFKGCTALTTIILPQSLERISSGAFRDCVKLTCVQYNGTRSEWMRVTIAEEYLKCDVICSDGTLKRETMEEYFEGNSQKT